MELYMEILSKMLDKREIEALEYLEAIKMNVTIEMKCYSIIQKIKVILEDESLEDKECMIKIEEIICALENAGVSIWGRHDFG